MRSTLRCACVLALVSICVGACSSSGSAIGTRDRAIHSSGGGGGSSESDASGSGGKVSSSGGAAETGGASSMCAADTMGNGCRACLAANCCTDYTACLADPVCSRALATHIACFSAPGAEQSACFGELSRTLQGDAGQAAGLGPIPICIITQCSAGCGGPGVV